MCVRVCYRRVALGTKNGNTRQQKQKKRKPRERENYLQARLHQPQEELPNVTQPHAIVGQERRAQRVTFCAQKLASGVGWGSKSSFPPSQARSLPSKPKENKLCAWDVPGSLLWRAPKKLCAKKVGARFRSLKY